MIQRIQSVYLLVSAVLGIVCLCRPLGYFLSPEGVRTAALHNLFSVSTLDGAHSFAPWVLFAVLAIATLLTLLCIFLYRYRALQMRIISFSMILLAGYYICFALLTLLPMGGLSFRPTVAAALPLVSMVLDYLAFRATLRDELLIRSLDRLR